MVKNTIYVKGAKKILESIASQSFVHKEGKEHIKKSGGRQKRAETAEKLKILGMSEEQIYALVEADPKTLERASFSIDRIVWHLQKGNVRHMKISSN